MTKNEKTRQKDFDKILPAIQEIDRCFTTISELSGSVLATLNSEHWKKVSTTFTPTALFWTKVRPALDGKYTPIDPESMRKRFQDTSANVEHFTQVLKKKK